MRTAKIGAFGALAVGVFLLEGCASVSIRMDYRPTSEARSIVGDKKPKLFLPKIEDKSRFSSPVFFYTTAKLKTPAAEGLREALTTELRRLGFKIEIDEQAADATLNATIQTAKIEYGDGRGLIRTKLAMELRLTDKSGHEIWTGDLKGEGDNKNSDSGAPSAAFTTSLNEAVANAMGKLGSLLEGDKVVSLIFPSSEPGTVAPAAATTPPPEPPERVVVSDVDELPARRAAPKPNAHAVVIGVRRYRQKLPEAEFSDNDARLVSKYLTQVMGYPQENVATLLNDRAQKSDFEKYFEQWLPNRVENGDDVFVYFSGHGAPNPTTGDAYLVPFDGDPTYLKETAYSLKKMYADLARLPAKRITVVMDSCFSGAGGRSVLAKGAKPLVSRVADEAVPENLTVLTASAGDQITYAYDEKGHGLFTYFLLKGLKEAGGELQGAFDYAAPQVSRVARREFNNDQVPQRQGSGH